MRKIILTALITFTATVFAQFPAKIKYQTIVRNSSGTELNYQLVSFRFSVLKTSPGGNAVYVETHSDTTNDFGLISFDIGGGVVDTGNFSNIDWGKDEYYLQVEIDESGGNNYTNMGTVQFLSVPYALHAQTVEKDSVMDDDPDPRNELIDFVKIENDSLKISEASVIFSVALEEMAGDADSDTANELITGTILVNDTLKIEEGNQEHHVDLSDLKSDFTMDIVNVFTVSTDTVYIADLSFVKIFSIGNHSELEILFPSASSDIKVSVDNNGTVSSYVLGTGDQENITTVSGGYIKILVSHYNVKDKGLLFEGNNMANGWIAGMLFYKD